MLYVSTVHISLSSALIRNRRHNYRKDYACPRKLLFNYILPRIITYVYSNVFKIARVMHTSTVYSTSWNKITVRILCF